MSKNSEITDEEFVPFLHKLGVETYNKSFEWMLGDPNFVGVLSWLYNNLDHNNALTAREEYRYAELEKNGLLLSPEDLETTLASIQEDYPGICLPGDLDALEDVKYDIRVHKERLAALEKQEKAIKELVKQNELVKEQLTIEVTKLHSMQLQLDEDEESAGKECLALADEVDTLTEGVVDVIRGALNVYTNCHVDKDLSKKFVSFGPLEAYRQSQALFRSHFDLYTERKFAKKYNESFTDEDHRSVLAEAKSLEERLSVAAFAYIESKAELCGEQAKLNLVSNYNNVHPSQIATLSVEAQTAIELKSQEEAILDQQIQSAVKDLVMSRTKIATDTATKMVLANREQILADLTHLQETSETALSLDRVLYCSLRSELRALTECVQFASQLHAYILGETTPVASRLESMNDIIKQQEASLQRLPQTDILLHFLCTILGASSTDNGALVKMYGDLLNRVRDLKSDVKEAYRKKEQALEDFKTSIRPLRTHVFNGCTKQPGRTDRTVASLAHSLRQQLESEENTVVQLGVQFTTVKNGDKQYLRKLWQWFLTDPSRLLAAVRGIPSSSYA